MSNDIISQLRLNLQDLLRICKQDASQPGCGWNTTTMPLGRWDMTGGLLADTLKRAVVEAEKRGLGDRAEKVFLRFLQPLAEPIPAVEEAIRFLERLDAMPVAALAGNQDAPPPKVESNGGTAADTTEATLAATLSVVQVGAPGLAEDMAYARDKSNGSVETRLAWLFLRDKRYVGYTRAAQADMLLCTPQAISSAISRSKVLKGFLRRSKKADD